MKISKSIKRNGGYLTHHRMLLPSISVWERHGVLLVVFRYKNTPCKIEETKNLLKY